MGNTWHCAYCCGCLRSLRRSDLQSSEEENQQKGVGCHRCCSVCGRDTIRAVLPAEDCDYFGAPKAEELHSEILYIGFWTDKGNADSATLELLSKLRDKKVFLFGTAGFGGSEAYFQKILEHVKQSIAPSNSVFGEYMCQGKMPQSVRDRYMKMKTQPEHPANIDALIENFDRALSHPDEDDLERLRKIVLDRQ